MASALTTRLVEEFETKEWVLGVNKSDCWRLEDYYRNKSIGFKDLLYGFSYYCKLGTFSPLLFLLQFFCQQKIQIKIKFALPLQSPLVHPHSNSCNPSSFFAFFASRLHPCPPPPNYSWFRTPHYPTPNLTPFHLIFSISPCHPSLPSL